MFQNLRPRPCHRATAAAIPSETGLPFGGGIAAGPRAAPTIPNGRSPQTGLAYRAAAQFRAPTSSQSSSNAIRGIQS
jgi:hypothetical protein